MPASFCYRSCDQEVGSMLARQIAIGFGIATVFPLLIYYGVSIYSPPPQFAAFRTPAIYTNDMSAEQRKAVQDRQKADLASYEEAARVFSFRLICVAAPLGYAAILLGARGLPSGLGAGMMFGGLFAVGGGYWWHWAHLPDWVRFITLLLAMAVLVFVGYRQRPTGGTRWSRPAESQG
jgi:hypothetical protein